MTGPDRRPRRLRATPAMRRLVAETRLHPAELILPLFVREGISQPVPIRSMRTGPLKTIRHAAPLQQNTSSHVTSLTAMTGPFRVGGCQLATVSLV